MGSGADGPGERTWEDRNPFRPERPSPPQRQSGFQRYRMFLILIGVFVVIAIVKGGFDRVDTRGADASRFVVFSQVLAEKPGKPRILPALGVIPAGGGEGRPLLALIAGRDQTLESLLDKGFYASLATLGLDAPNIAVLAVDRDSGAHDRDGAKWGTYLLREAIPAAVKQTRADPKRVAIGGFGQGGFGALNLARLHPRRFCAVGGHSPEIWPSWGLVTRQSSFDDAADFARHDLLAAARAGTYLDAGPVRVDIGSDDPQLATVKAFADALRASGRTVDYHELAGTDSPALWRANSGNLLRFYAAALAGCSGRG